MAKNAVGRIKGWDDRLWVREGMSSFPLQMLRLFLWITLISGLLLALFTPDFALLAPQLATLEVPVEINTPFDDTKEHEVWGVGVTITTNKKDPNSFEPTEGKISVLVSQLGPAQRFTTIVGSSILALGWSFGAWLLIKIVRTLPEPFVAENTKRLRSLGYLGTVINSANYIFGNIIAFNVSRSLDHFFPTLGKSVESFKDFGNYIFTWGGQGLNPSFSIPWSVVLGVFALALVFRIGVQHREREQVLEAEQELTV